MKETKIVTCTKCGTSITVSKFASAKTAECDECKKGSKLASKPVIQDSKLQEIAKDLKNIAMDIHTNGNIVPQQVSTVINDCISDVAKPVGITPVDIIIRRNRSEIEGTISMSDGSYVNRIPVTWHKEVNDLDYLSVSKMTTYERCPAQFYEINMSGNFQEDDAGNIYTQFGTILHNTNERVEKIFEENGIKVDPVEIFNDEWKMQPCMDLRLYKECVALIKDYYRRNPIGSRPYKPLMIPDIDPTSGVTTGEFRSGIEYEWRGYIGDVLFGCKFDYLGEMKDTPTRIGLIADYKSNRMPFSQQDLDDSLQLSVYELIASRYIAPEIEQWITGYDLYRYGWQQCPPRHKHDLDMTFDYIQNIHYQITHDNVWEEKLNNLCGYCIRRHKCKKYADFINDPNTYIKSVTFDPTNIEEIESARSKFADYEKLIKNRKDELNKQVIAAIQNATMNGEKFIVGDKELYLQSQCRPFYDYTALSNTLALHGQLNLLGGCTSVNRQKLDPLVKAICPDIVDELDKCLINSYTSPYIMSKKVKK